MENNTVENNDSVGLNTNGEISTKTLADEIKTVPNESLPVYLQYDGVTDKDANKKNTPAPTQPVQTNESEDSNEHRIELVKRFFEAKGDRAAMKKYILATADNPDDRSFDDFNDKGYNSTNLQRSEYNAEMKLYADGKYGTDFNMSSGLSDDDTENPVSNENVKPTFNPDDEAANKLERMLFNTIGKVNSKTYSVEESVEDKYFQVFELSKNIANESSLKNFGLIAGQAGIGKCEDYNEQITIKVDDKRVSELSKYLKLNYVVLLNSITLKIGSLFDFIKDMYNIPFGIDTFVDAPFPISILDENDNWVSIKRLIIKKDDIWETKFNTGLCMRTAANHLVCFYPKKDLNKYTKDIKSGDELKYLNATVTFNKKVEDNANVYGIEVDSESHLYKDTMGVIHHNTYTVDNAVDLGQKQWKANARHTTLPTIEKKTGSIGTSFSPLLIFFYKNRHNKLIVLDDADGFLTVADQDIQNFIKAIVTGNLKPISAPLSIRAKANNIMQKESNISVNTDHIAEGRCSVNVNGTDIDFKVSMDEAVELGSIFGYKKLDSYNENYKNNNIKFDRFGNLVTQVNLEEAEENQPTDAEKNIFNKIASVKRTADIDADDSNISEENQIPEQFIFDSSIIFITNLKLGVLDKAVRSRMDCYEIYLTPAEFLCRAEQILPNLKMGIYSSSPQPLIEWVKREAFAFMKIIILDKDKYSNWNVEINCPLDFRLIETISGRFLARANAYCEKNNIDANDVNKRPEIEDGVSEPFIRDLLTILKTKD